MSLDTIRTLLEEGKFRDVAATIEMQSFHQDGLNHPLQWTLLAIGHLINNDLEFARFACKRAPEAVQVDAEFQSTFQLLQLLWNREFKHAWPLMRSVSWSQEAGVMIVALGEQLQRRVMELLERSYSTILPSTACELSGCTSEQLHEEARRRGWVYNKATGALNIQRLQEPATADMDLSMLKTITDHMIALDS